VPSGLRRVVPTVFQTAGLVQRWRGRDGNDPSVDIAKDADQRFEDGVESVRSRPPAATSIRGELGLREH
jgi:hypothetical protein